ncbi:hypothetical protein QYE76_025914 [Lolium multiflorum]|uniref:Uncharacterized protein n=1 Tax=Lolium multiflorum TaxID=4521 RepID=A0AAD8RHQ4_LOLMU|nr:hypothetical protein QYE76_025914 [Lolium multiflorum]
MKRPTSGEPLPPPPRLHPAGRQAGAENANLEHHEANQVHHGGRYLAEDATYIIFTSEPEDKTSQQSRSLEVNAVIPPVPTTPWSSTPPSAQPGACASRASSSTGQRINILYRDTARKLGIQEAELRPTPTVFHGTHRCQPIGRITLEVMFGKPDHFRTERIEFEVVDLVSPYHALLGRPALTKFMAVPHYGYLKMKLPGPKGVITIAGDYRGSMDATQSSKMAQTLVIATEKQLIHDAAARQGRVTTCRLQATRRTTHFSRPTTPRRSRWTRRTGQISDEAQPGQVHIRRAVRQLLGYLALEVSANPEKIVPGEDGTAAGLKDVRTDEAFRDLKRVLSTAPILATPASMEPMLLYIAATNRVVSVVLVVERKEAGEHWFSAQSP